VPLHPQAAQFLLDLAEQKLPPWSEMSVQEARKLFNSLQPLFGSAEPIQHVRNVRLASGLQMRVYHPDDERHLPVVIYMHGGGWVMGDCDTHDALCRRLANRSSCCLVSVDYRLAPEHKHPQPLDDCLAALHFVARHPDELRIDGHRIGVAGDSAGGNLAATLAILNRDQAGPPLTCQLLIYPVIEPNFETVSYREFSEGFGLTRESMIYFWQSHLADSEQTAQPSVCPNRAASLQHLPRTHVITAEYDVLCDEGESFARQLLDAGVPTTHHRYDGMLHGFIHFSEPFDDGKLARDDAAQFLHDALHGALPEHA
jgi:acetyl esterase/lipase